MASLTFHISTFVYVTTLAVMGATSTERETHTGQDVTNARHGSIAALMPKVAVTAARSCTSTVGINGTLSSSSQHVSSAAASVYVDDGFPILLVDNVPYVVTITYVFVAPVSTFRSVTIASAWGYRIISSI